MEEAGARQGPASSTDSSAAQHSSSYYYGYTSPGSGDQKYLDLSACESRQLWPVLEQAHREIS